VCPGAALTRLLHTNGYTKGRYTTPRYRANPTPTITPTITDTHTQSHACTHTHRHRIAETLTRGSVGVWPALVQHKRAVVRARKQTLARRRHRHRLCARGAEALNGRFFKHYPLHADDDSVQMLVRSGAFSLSSFVYLLRSNKLAAASLAQPFLSKAPRAPAR
jgi:hypothetical protein